MRMHRPGSTSAMRTGSATIRNVRSLLLLRRSSHSAVYARRTTGRHRRGCHTIRPYPQLRIPHVQRRARGHIPPAILITVPVA